MEARPADNGITKDQMHLQLPPNCLQEAEYRFTVWESFIPSGIDADALLKPNFWSLYAARFKPFDEIRARTEDGTWLSRFIVLEAGRTWARVQRLEHHTLGTQDVALTRAAGQAVEDARKQFTVRNRGQAGWSVVRNSDKQVMHEGEQSKLAADKWLDDYLRRAEAPQEPQTA